MLTSARDQPYAAVIMAVDDVSVDLVNIDHVNIDQVNGQRVHGQASWVPRVSVTGVTDGRGPRAKLVLKRKR